jgi:hypothetical protein
MQPHSRAAKRPFLRREASVGGFGHRAEVPADPAGQRGGDAQGRRCLRRIEPQGLSAGRCRPETLGMEVVCQGLLRSAASSRASPTTLLAPVKSRAFSGDYTSAATSCPGPGPVGRPGDRCRQSPDDQDPLPGGRGAMGFRVFHRCLLGKRGSPVEGPGVRVPCGIRSALRPAARACASAWTAGRLCSPCHCRTVPARPSPRGRPAPSHAGRGSSRSGAGARQCRPRTAR